MPLENWTSDDLDFLKQLYPEESDWSWSGISSRETQELRHIADWLEQLPAPRTNPVALPIKKKGGPSWLIIAFSESQCEEVRELLNAFLGRFCSSYMGVRTPSDPDDPLHQAATEWAGGRWIFEFHAADERKRVRTALQDMLRTLALRPLTNSGILRTTEGLLREFRSALVNKDQRGADELLKTIRLTGRLSAENLRFLRIEYYGAFGLWREMRLGSEWPLIIRSRKPRRTTALMIEAVWWTNYHASLPDMSVEEAFDLMRSRILPESKALFRSTRIPLNQAAALTFLIAASCDSPARPDQARNLLELIPQDSEYRPFAESVFATIPRQPEPTASEVVPVDPFTIISSKLRNDDYDGAWALLLKAESGIGRCKMMLECAYEFLSPESAEIVYDAVQTLEEPDRSKLLSSRNCKNHWDEVTSLIRGTSMPASWEEWFDLLEAGEDLSTINRIARSADEEWNLEEYTNQPERICELATRIETAASSSPALRQSTPYIASFFLPDSTPRAEFIDVYLSILCTTALSDHMTAQDWTMIETLACATLVSNPSRQNYSDMVDAANIFWENRAELGRLGWALDLLDALIVGPPLDEDAMGDFFSTIRNTCVRYARRIAPDQRNYFRLLCEDLGRQEEFAGIQWANDDEEEPHNRPPQETLVADRLKGRSVGIYSLNESAAIRASDLISTLSTDVRVRLSHDHGGSEKLKVIARDSDFLIVVTQSAKHAATDFIKAQRPKSATPLIYPGGRGAASIVTALTQAIFGAPS